MDKLTGNFLTQANRDFPLDCETLDALQNLAAMAALAGNLAGGRAILRGCSLSPDGATRSEGYVFLRTKDFPDGEVLRFTGGAAAEGMHVAAEDVAVQAQGYAYPKAYTRRTLAPGAGSENFAWDGFVRADDFASLPAALADETERRNSLAASLAPPPLGIVQLWAGSKVPDGYALCDGRQLSADEYPELYEALGTAFNTACSAAGARYTTSAGCFRLPDLRGRFVAGYHDSDNDYRTLGNAGGEKQHTLEEAEMPAHAHSLKDYYFAEESGSVPGASNKDLITTNGKYGTHGRDTDNDSLLWYRHDTDKAGEGAPHENRPPYYVLAYIMRLR